MADPESLLLAATAEVVAWIQRLEQRIDELERHSATIGEAIAFHQTRTSWTVKQLAEDLQVHPNTILNYVKLPETHPRHLETFQPGGTGPHMILPQHVYAWMIRQKPLLSPG